MSIISKVLFTARVEFYTISYKDDVFLQWKYVTMSVSISASKRYAGDR